MNKLWNIYTQKTINQKISSAKTARIQIPRSFSFLEQYFSQQQGLKLLDIGCGIGNKKFSDKVINIGIDYYGCDPFNISQEDNVLAINECMEGQSHIVTINNVLNTIKEENVWKDIILQAENALHPTEGLLIVIIYEGAKLSKELSFEKENNVKLPLTPIKTRDGWQNRMKTELYLPAIQSILPHSKIINFGSGKIIVASKNKDFDLNFK